MKNYKQFMISTLLFFVLSCAKGYKEGEPLQGAALALAQRATQLTHKVENLDDEVPSTIQEMWEPFVDNVRLFDNSCQRHSCDSLEARNDFNHLRYYAVQLDSLITQKKHPAIYPDWKEIREEYVDFIGKELGYRIE